MVQKTKGDRLAAAPPHEITMSILHAFARFEKIFARENFELDRRAVGDLQIERVDFVDDVGAIGQDFESNGRRRELGLAQFTAQSFRVTWLNRVSMY
jgi:hypothetical protein